MSEEKVDEMAISAAKAMYLKVHSIRAAVSAYLAAAQKPAPERVGITEEERIELMGLFKQDDMTAFLEALNSLTTPRPVQGFEPDWSKADKGTKGWAGGFTRSFEEAYSTSTRGFIYIPRPAPAKLTAEEIHAKALVAVLDEGTRASEYRRDPVEVYNAKKAELTSLDGSPRP